MKFHIQSQQRRLLHIANFDSITEKCFWFIQGFKYMPLALSFMPFKAVAIIQIPSTNLIDYNARLWRISGRRCRSPAKISSNFAQLLRSIFCTDIIIIISIYTRFSLLLLLFLLLRRCHISAKVSVEIKDFFCFCRLFCPDAQILHGANIIISINLIIKRCKCGAQLLAV